MNPDPPIPETLPTPYQEETPGGEEDPDPASSTPSDREFSDDELYFQPMEGNQGARIKQLEEFAEQMAQRNAADRRRLRQLEREDRDLEEQVFQRQRTHSTSAIPMSTADRLEALVSKLANENDNKDIKPPSYIRYSGKPSELRAFLTDCDDYIDLNPKSINTDDKKIMLVGMLLTGSAKLWYRQYREVAPDRRPAFMSNYEDFKIALDKAWGDPDLKASHERAFARLRQTTSVAAYATQFRQHMVYLNFPDDDQTLPVLFYKGLKDPIKDEVSREGRKDHLQDLMDQATRIDNRIAARIRERNDETSTPFRQSTTEYSRGVSANAQRIPSGNQAWKKTTTVARVTTTADNDYTQHLTRDGKVTKAEKERRKALGLCFYCGKGKHPIEECQARIARALEKVAPAPRLSANGASK